MYDAAYLTLPFCADVPPTCKAAEALAEEMVKDFATRAKKEAQQRESRTSDSGDDSPTSVSP